MMTSEDILLLTDKQVQKVVSSFIKDKKLDGNWVDKIIDNSLGNELNKELKKRYSDRLSRLIND